MATGPTRANYAPQFAPFPPSRGWRVIPFVQVNGITEIDGETRFGEK